MSEVAAGYSRAGADSRAPDLSAHGSRFLLGLVLVTLFLPFTFSIGSIVLSPSRALFLVLVPIQLANLLTGRYGKVTNVDWLILAYMAWRTLIPFIHDPRIALQYAGSNSIIFLGGYLAARACIRSAEDFHWMAKFLAGAIFFSLPFVIYEAITGKFVIPKLFEMIPGVRGVKDVGYGRRMGIDRVQFVFSHPIHYGLVCSLALSLYFVALKNIISGFRRWAGSAIIVFCCFLSVSSGPFLSALVQVMLIGYGYFYRKVDRRWFKFGVAFGVIYIILEVASNRPAIVALTSRLTFSSSTANVRFILFDYGMEQIAKTPIIGIGFRQWDLPSWMTGSLDNFWLAIALVFGVPAFLLQISACIVALVGVGKRPFLPDGALANVRLGWAIMMVSLMLTLATVYIWSEVASLVMFMIGSGVFLLHAEERGAAGMAPAEAEPRRNGISYSRFAASRHRGGTATDQTKPTPNSRKPS